LLWELGAFSSRAGGADVPLTADALAAVSNTLARARANGGQKGVSPVVLTI
jgi:hypothetical protein